MSSASIVAPRSRRNVAISTVAAKCKRRLPVTTAGVHDLGVGGHQLAQADPSIPRRAAAWASTTRAALDEQRHEIGVGRIQHAEAARPPAASGVDVGAGVEQHLDHRAIAPVDRAQNRRRTEREAGNGSLMPATSAGCCVSVCRTRSLSFDWMAAASRSAGDESARAFM